MSDYSLLNLVYVRHIIILKHLMNVVQINQNCLYMDYLNGIIVGKLLCSKADKSIDLTPYTGKL